MDQSLLSETAKAARLERALELFYADLAAAAEKASKLQAEAKSFGHCAIDVSPTPAMCVQDSQ